VNHRYSDRYAPPHRTAPHRSHRSRVNEFERVQRRLFFARPFSNGEKNKPPLLRRYDETLTADMLLEAGMLARARALFAARRERQRVKAGARATGFFFECAASIHVSNIQ